VEGQRLILPAIIYMYNIKKEKRKMDTMSKWICFLALAVLVLGYWYIVLLAVGLVAYVLVLLLKPEWLDRIPE